MLVWEYISNSYANIIKLCVKTLLFFLCPGPNAAMWQNWSFLNRNPGMRNFSQTGHRILSEMVSPAMKRRATRTGSSMTRTKPLPASVLAGRDRRCRFTEHS